jgi:hypothetical protein
MKAHLLKTFTIANYDPDGDLHEQQVLDPAGLNSEIVSLFQAKLSRLSGDLDLPLEVRLPGEFSDLQFSIVSDLNAAYALYYWGDEVVFASLYLRGDDEENETELAHVFKFLLLDTEDSEDPTDEQIDEVLASDAFDFPAVADRPVAFAIRFLYDPDAEEMMAHVAQMDRCLAAAFLSDRK